MEGLSREILGGLRPQIPRSPPEPYQKLKDSASVEGRLGSEWIVFDGID